MSQYDFSRLNDKEFEEFCCDLIEIVEKVKVERFKPGRDGGIDGRFYKSGTTIIQCKHYINTPFSNLKKVLLTEKEKLKNITPIPDRYILITSCGLTPHNKEEIYSLLSPFIINSSDIITINDIESHVKNNSELERKHYKLWLASTNVLKNLLNNGVLGRSDDFIEVLKSESMRYYKTNDYKTALKRLDNTGVVLITGGPGVGKTTLANQMCLHFMAHKYSIIYMENDTSEGESVFSPDDDDKQLFYFDDFLGRNYLDALQNKEDSKIVSFINRVIRSKNKKLILTSRTTILNQCISISEIIRRESINKHEYEVNVEGLNEFDKANILYNHLWHSNLSRNFCDEIYNNKKYNVIIKHRNYNPRIISFITNPDKLDGITPLSYWQHIYRSLENPTEIWGHLYHNQINKHVRYITTLTSLNNEAISESDLMNAYNKVLELDTTHNPLDGVTFQDHIIPAVKSTLVRVIRGSEVYYNIFNPSIGDFIIRKYKNDIETLKIYFTALQTFSSLKNLYSLKTQFCNQCYFYDILIKISENIDVDRGMEYFLDYSFMFANNKLKNSVIEEKIISQLDKIDVSFLPINVRTLVLIDWALSNNYLNNRLGSCSVFLHHAIKSGCDHSDLLLCLRMMKNIGNTIDLENELREAIFKYWKDDIQNQATDENKVCEIIEYSRIDECIDLVRNMLNEKLMEFPFVFSDKEIDSIMNNCNCAQIIESNNEAYNNSYDDDHDDINPTEDFSTKIDDLFDRQDVFDI